MRTLTKIVLLLILMCSTIASADFRACLEARLVDTKIGITSQNHSDFAIAELFIDRLEGRFFLGTFLITLKESFTLPLGVGAILRGPSRITPNTQDIPIENYTAEQPPTPTLNQNLLRANIGFTGILRMIHDPSRNRIHVMLLREIIRRGLLPVELEENYRRQQEQPTLPGTETLPRIETDSNTGRIILPQTMQPHEQLQTLEANTIPIPPRAPFHWLNLPGDAAYIIPRPTITEAHDPPPYMLAIVHLKGANNPTTFVEMLLLHPGEILPRLPGLYVDIHATNYRATENLYIRHRPAPTTTTLENGITEMLELQHDRENGTIYRRILVAIAALRPEQFRTMWDAAPNTQRLLEALAIPSRLPTANPQGVAPQTVAPTPAPNAAIVTPQEIARGTPDQTTRGGLASFFGALVQAADLLGNSKDSI